MCRNTALLYVALSLLFRRVKDSREFLFHPIKNRLMTSQYSFIAKIFVVIWLAIDVIEGNIQFPHKMSENRLLSKGSSGLFFFLSGCIPWKLDILKNIGYIRSSFPSCFVGSIDERLIDLPDALPLAFLPPDFTAACDTDKDLGRLFLLRLPYALFSESSAFHINGAA
jgi:hypothetical protein